MSKSSGKKKKKASSPEPIKVLPKILRTPQGQARTPVQEPGEGQDKADKRGARKPGQGGSGTAGAHDQGTTQAPRGQSIKALLLAMEVRVTGRIDRTNEQVRESLTLSRITNEHLGQLEIKVDANEEAVKEALAMTENRIMSKMNEQIGQMVREQLKKAGFDPDLTETDRLTVEVRHQLS